MTILAIILIIFLVGLAVTIILTTINLFSEDYLSVHQAVPIIIATTIISLGVAGGFSYDLIRHHPEKKVYNIVSAKVKDAISGRFYIGSGRVESKLVIYVLEDTSSGFKYHTINAKNLLIIETDEKQPCYTEQKESWRIETINRLYIPLNTIIVDYDFTI